ncbi:MAG: thioredoxin family protein [Phycisphaerae bacterium]
MSERGDREKLQWRPAASQPVVADELEWAIEGPLTIVHFWAPWNPYDKTMDANLQALQADAGGVGKRFRFLSANTDETVFEPIVEKFHVGALPTLLCFLNGKVVGRFHGVQTLDELRQFLQEMTHARAR